MYHATSNFLQIWVLVSQYFPVFVFCLEFLEPLSNDGICPLFTGLGEKERKNPFGSDLCCADAPWRRAAPTLTPL